MEPTVSEYAPLPYPSTVDVAALLRARTKDLNGTELGIFTPDTRPTAVEVEHLITLAYGEVTGQSGIDLGVRCTSLASSLVVIRAAMWVELSYFPEQLRTDRSVYRELADQWTAGMPQLLACVEGNLPAGADGGDDGYGALRFGMLPVWGATAAGYAGPFPVTPAPAVVPLLPPVTDEA